MTTHASHLSLLLLLSLLAAGQQVLVAAVAGRCHPDDESALLAFKNAMKDPSGILATWKPNTDCCGWDGVTCRANPTRVTELYVSGVDALTAKSSLAGAIPLSFSKLQMLRMLQLVNLKNLTGPFPAAILGLFNLDYLEITYAQLSGPLPVDIGRRLPKLEHITLTKCKFSGRLPPSLAELSHLTQLDLSENQFVGQIPTVLANLKNLSVLDLGSNSLSGTIPDLSSLSELGWLSLDHNRLNGGIPALPPQLTTLSLGNNFLSGTIPAHLGNLVNLRYFDLSVNLFKGPVPPTFSSLAELSVFNLSNNLLEDPFPAMNVKNIFALDLSGNKFNLGTIPRWVESSTEIYYLGLKGCGLRMRMEDVKPLGTYEILDLSDNEITGNPGGFLIKARELAQFTAANNRMRFDMGRLTFIAGTLRVLDISHNQVYGTLPEDITNIDKLDVSYNQLCGPIPGPNKFPASAFANNNCLCGAPLRPCHRRGV